MDLDVSGISASMLELDKERLDKNAEFTSSTMPKKRHFYTNAAPVRLEGNVFRYDFDEKVSINIIHMYFGNLMR